MHIKLDSISLFFDVEGLKFRPRNKEMLEVPTVVLLHGGPAFDHSHFKPGFSRLTDVAQVVYLDHRGHGRSDWDHCENWNLTQWADDVKAFCDALGIVKPIVLGSSFGGFVAMAYATRYPDHPGKLILASTAATTHLDRKLDAFEQLGGKRARAAAERFWLEPTESAIEDYMQICMPLYNTKQGDSDSVARVNMNTEAFMHFVSLSQEMHRYDYRPQLSKISCPTLITVGDKDPITPLGDAEEILLHLPENIGRLEVFEDAGHGVDHDQPEKVFQLYREFILS